VSSSSVATALLSAVVVVVVVEGEWNAAPPRKDRIPPSGDWNKELCFVVAVVEAALVVAALRLPKKVLVSVSVFVWRRLLWEEPKRGDTDKDSLVFEGETWTRRCNSV